MELINKKFNVWACSIMELTFEDIKFFLDTYKSEPLSNFAFGYDDKMGKIILIKEYKGFELYAQVVPAYLEADEATRLDMKSRFKKAIPEDNFDILDMAIEYRYCRETMRILNKQFSDTYLEDNVIDFIETDIKNGPEKQMYLFNYGIILGKRMEREKKKAANRSRQLTAKVK